MIKIAPPMKKMENGMPMNKKKMNKSRSGACKSVKISLKKLKKIIPTQPNPQIQK